MTGGHRQGFHIVGFCVAKPALPMFAVGGFYMTPKQIGDMFSGHGMSVMGVVVIYFGSTGSFYSCNAHRKPVKPPDRCYRAKSDHRTFRSTLVARIIAAGVGQTVATTLGSWRKVRAPQDTVPGNAWGARAYGKCHRKHTANVPQGAGKGEKVR